EPDHAIQQGCVLRNLHHRSEELPSLCLVRGTRELRDEVVHDPEQPRVTVVRLSAGPGHIPTVDHYFVQGHQTGHVAGQLDPPNLGRPVPRRRLPPRLRQDGEIPWYPGSPVVAEPRRIARRAFRPCFAPGLGGGGGEGEG